MNVLSIGSVVPAVIPHSFSHLDEVLHDIAPFSDAVQIDVVDGIFVPFTSWPYRGHGNILLVTQFATAFNIEFDLMVAVPETFIDSYARTGARRIVVHLESIEDISPILAAKAEHGFLLGLSISNETPIEVLTRELATADYIQLMGIAEIGSQGQPFDERVLSRIEDIRKVTSLPISIDGSVNETTLPRLKKAGASRFVAGSSILKAPDPEIAFRALETLAES